MSAQSTTGLLLDMARQPKRTAAYSYNNPIAFDAAGTTLYGLDTTLIQLRAIQVLVDGLAEQSAVAYSAPYGTQTLSFANNRVIVGRDLFDTPALAQAGFISGAADCVPQRAGTLLLCLAVQDNTGRVRILVADSGTFVMSASLLAATSEPSPATRRLVQGPSGQVAISYSIPSFSVTPPFLRLFSSSQLP